MSTIDSWHPDVIEFITAKQTAGRLTKFNMSVNCTDEFMDRINRIKSLSNLDPAQIVGSSGVDGATVTVQDELQKLDKWDLIYPDTTHPAYSKEWQGNIKA